MVQEDKELLLVDLCARLPYSTLCYCKWTKDAPNGTSGCIQEVSTYLLDELMIIGDENYECQICEIKPYLRSMSSMTEEEYKSVSWEGCSHTYNYSSKSGFRFVEIKTFTLNILNWLNAHHFDYRGLIERGLAIEVNESNNPYKN